MMLQKTTPETHGLTAPASVAVANTVTIVSQTTDMTDQSITVIADVTEAP